ncbi:MAG: glycine zipper 2TM domain-containing protein [Candidatus Omnitrophota bacterium]
MKRISGIIAAVVMAMSQFGCASSPNRAAEGSIIGGILGAGAGAIIGNQSRDRDKGRTQGALIGGAVGALGGALAGSQVQKQPAQQQASAAGGQVSNPNQMPLSQIVELSKQGVHEDVIVDRIRLTNSKYMLSQADVEYLQQNGVSHKVLLEMQGL